MDAAESLSHLAGNLCLECSAPALANSAVHLSVVTPDQIAALDAARYSATKLQDECTATSEMSSSTCSIVGAWTACEKAVVDASLCSVEELHRLLQQIGDSAELVILGDVCPSGSMSVSLVESQIQKMEILMERKQLSLDGDCQLLLGQTELRWCRCGVENTIQAAASVLSIMHMLQAGQLECSGMRNSETGEHPSGEAQMLCFAGKVLNNKVIPYLRQCSVAHADQDAYLRMLDDITTGCVRCGAHEDLLKRLEAACKNNSESFHSSPDMTSWSDRRFPFPVRDRKLVTEQYGDAIPHLRDVQDRRFVRSNQSAVGGVWSLIQTGLVPTVAAAPWASRTGLEFLSRLESLVYARLFADLSSGSTAAGGLSQLDEIRGIVGPRTTIYNADGTCCTNLHCILVWHAESGKHWIATLPRVLLELNLMDCMHDMSCLCGSVPETLMGSFEIVESNELTFSRQPPADRHGALVIDQDSVREGTRIWRMPLSPSGASLGDSKVVFDTETCTADPLMGTALKLVMLPSDGRPIFVVDIKSNECVNTSPA